jgi:protocatechuate 3,4-dioxygenase beta subunit
MLLHILALILALATPQAKPSNAVIEGRVLKAGTTEPIPNVQVTLSGPPAAGAPPLAGNAANELDNRIQSLIATGTAAGVGQAAIDNAVANARTSAGAAAGQQTSIVTDSSGHFSFKDLSPGKYNLRATRDGFFGPPVNGSASTIATKTITIEAQNPVPPADLFMVQGGIISGRIRDPNGQPISGVTVAATHVTYTNGRAQWTSIATKPTDDRGEYRIFWVSPGEYAIGITPRALSAIPGPQDSWARTFYPGVTDPATATTLTVKDGMEISGTDFTIQTVASTAVFKITGKAQNPQAVPNPNTGVADRNINTFILSPREPGILDSLNPPSVQNALPVASRPNGEFEIRNVRMGSYDLIAYYLAPVTALPAPPVPAVPGAPAIVTPPVRRYNIDRVHVEVRNADVDGVSLSIQKGSEISGKIVNQGTSPIPLDRVRLSLHSLDTLPESFATIVGSIPVDADGSFSAKDIAAAKYSLQVTGLPETAYVVDIRQGGTSIFDGGMTVGEQAVTSIEVLVGSNTATLDGNVQSADRKPVANATVVLVPPVSHRSNSMMYRMAHTDENGNFSMKGIPPGEFTLFAWENVYPTAWMNADFLAKYQNRGRPIAASQGSHIDAQVDVIPDDTNRR